MDISKTLSDPFAQLLIRMLVESTDKALKAQEDYPGYMPEPGVGGANEIDCEPGLSAEFRRHIRVERRDAIREQQLAASATVLNKLSGDVGEHVAFMQRRIKELKESCCADLPTKFDMLVSAFEGDVLLRGLDKCVSPATTASKVVSFVDGLKRALTDPAMKSQINSILAQAGVDAQVVRRSVPVAEPAAPDAATILSALDGILFNPTAREAINEHLKSRGFQVVSLGSPPAATPPAAPPPGRRRKAHPTPKA